MVVLPTYLLGHFPRLQHVLKLHRAANQDSTSIQGKTPKLNKAANPGHKVDQCSPSHFKEQNPNYIAGD